MRLTAKISVLIIFFALFALEAAGQRIRVARSDVDSTRAGFVTAKYIFGLDIYVDSVKKCNNVNFLLQYNQTKYIKFNGYKVGALGENGSSAVNPSVKAITDEGFISVIVLAGTAPELDTVQNAHVIRLEFAVTQSVPHGEKVIFLFNNPTAVISEDTLRKEIQLNTTPLELKIHSFIDVWPGDANNDGKVDHNDGAAIATYVLLDPTVNHKRSFKRENASTRWAAQRVLAWDMAGATYADCDGNGYVTITDVLIVYLNYDSTHIVLAPKSGKDTPQSPEKETVFGGEGYISVPVKVNSEQEFIGVSGRASLDMFSNIGRFVGINKGKLFDCEKCHVFFAYNQEENYVDFAVGKGDKSEPVKGAGTVAELVFESKPFTKESFAPAPLLLTAISPGGYIYTIGSITSVEDENDYSFESENINISDNLLTIKSRASTPQIRFFNSLGIEIQLSLKYSHLGSSVFDISTLPTGAYFAVVAGSSASGTLPFIIVK